LRELIGEIYLITLKWVVFSKEIKTSYNKVKEREIINRRDFKREKVKKMIT
jgi:hypothetical protein